MKKWRKLLEGTTELHHAGETRPAHFEILIDPARIDLYAARAHVNKNGLAKAGPLLIRAIRPAGVENN